MTRIAGVLRVSLPTGSRSCVVADSPHSGTTYPADFNYACDFAELRKAEDAHVDRLFDFMPALGVPLLQAEFPRSYVDPNREDSVTPRIRAGDDKPYVPVETGLIRKRCTPRSAQDVYDRPIPLTEAFNRVAGYHAPYHAALEKLLDETAVEQGRVVHVNCHSMPSTMYRGTQTNPHDIIIGTWYGQTCAPEIAAKLKELFEARGYSVALDVPGYRGAEIIRRHGKPQENRHSLQLELNRGLYMDEETLALKPEAAKLKTDLEAVMRDFVGYCEGLPPMRPTPQRRPPAP